MHNRSTARILPCLPGERTETTGSVGERGESGTETFEQRNNLGRTCSIYRGLGVAFSLALNRTVATYTYGAYGTKCQNTRGDTSFHSLYGRRFDVGRRHYSRPHPPPSHLDFFSRDRRRRRRRNMQRVDRSAISDQLHRLQRTDGSTRRRGKGGNLVPRDAAWALPSGVENWDFGSFRRRSLRVARIGRQLVFQFGMRFAPRKTSVSRNFGASTRRLKYFSGASFFEERISVQ